MSEVWIDDVILEECIDRARAIVLAFDENTDTSILAEIKKIEEPQKYELKYMESEMMDAFASGFKAGMTWGLSNNVIESIED
jgi:hypothetical protein